MGFVIAGLIVAVFWLANRANAVGAPLLGTTSTASPAGADAQTLPHLRGILGPNLNLPSLGATDKFSPALTGGSPLIARDNRTRLGISYVNARQRRSRAVIQNAPPGSQTGILGNLTDASASGSFAKEHPLQLTTRPAVYMPAPANKLQRFKF